MQSPVNAAERLAMIGAMIERARRRFGQPPEKVTLVAVSKTFPAEAIAPFINAGQRVFGENRVQEAKTKWPALRALHPDLELHLIGPLQTNKAREAVALFDVIETVDRDKLAGVLAEEMARGGRRLPVFVQVNIGLEPQKAGIAPQEAVAFVTRCRQVHGLEVAGLMCIPPEDQPPGPYFAQLAMLGGEAGVNQLSMGMSGDFETAIGMGATHVRLGSALFGQRPPLPQGT
ncbi:YggS family pyridoxal phosphate-dependent enzyme [Arsenicitalea aurantiaca]|uniref:Pyridoxal phosphate homeostasis protein n=1 Tax=Arsenicitalea aurantiaca TaxID=1783274 RepID=A0A433X7W7_9HYPH|nr:YggS family pyridoxal phosphate-dependent enzyme [Arsenicitalea aurantiaca]RUT30138.1 YggS family pyridoxal phosphate-dependent enzyme [Arsenicitalea aurantiaca]